MDVLFAILVGVATSFLMLLGLIGVGKVLEKINENMHWTLELLIGFIFLVIYFGILSVPIVVLIENFGLKLNVFGIGIVLGWFLYIPFAKWKKLYK